MQKLRITIENRVYEVLVEIVGDGATPAPAAPASAAPAVVAPPAASPAPAPRPVAAAAGSGEIASPLAGKVVSIEVKPGQRVAAGATLVTLEAMKMNTYVYAPRDGVVAALLVNPGDGVEEGAPLLRLE
jgi:biotin carboxyl carrier protein